MRAGAALEAARRADARQAPQEQAEIQDTGPDQEVLANVGVPPQVHPSLTPGLVEMDVGLLETFAALEQQPPAAGPPDSPLVGIHGVPGGVLAAPASSAAVRLRHVAAQPQLAASATIGSLLWYPLSATTSTTPPPAGSTASTCSAAVTSVSTIVVLSPELASCTVMPTTAG